MTHDNWSFADELEALIPQLRAFSRSLCKQHILADDLVQDTCLKAWSRVDQYDRSRELRPWLFQILRNEFYQHKRKNWRLVDTEIEPLMAAMSVDATQDHIIDAGIAIRALDVLSRDQRDAFVLVIAGGFTYEEAGEICDCASGTIKSRVNRARKRILSSMESSDDWPEADGSASFDVLLDEIDKLCSDGSAAA
ncbi:MAG: sigma-70 family RNA polymerase sigma factor [Pseudomonadota bacterium]